MDSIAGPIDRVTRPGCFTKALRRQHSPALCATGMTAAPVREASSAPPILKRPVLPGATRVPSGNSRGQRPSSRRVWPCFTTCSKASRPLERSIAIMRRSASPQPKNGTMCSSFL
ncbi:hypothetical protein D3C72_1801050 [compost metagenome]